MVLRAAASAIRGFSSFGVYIFSLIYYFYVGKKKRLKMTTGSFLSLGIPQRRPAPASSVSIATVPAPHVRPAPLLAPRVLRAPPPCRPAACARPSLAPPGEPCLENPAGEPRLENLTWRTPPGAPLLCPPEDDPFAPSPRNPPAMLLLWLRGPSLVLSLFSGLLRATHHPGVQLKCRF